MVGRRAQGARFPELVPKRVARRRPGYCWQQEAYRFRVPKVVQSADRRGNCLGKICNPSVATTTKGRATALVKPYAGRCELFEIAIDAREIRRPAANLAIPALKLLRGSRFRRPGSTKDGRVELWARVAELADALDLGSSGQPWGFESPLSHFSDPRRQFGHGHVRDSCTL